MDPLIVTATPNLSWLNPELETYPHSLAELIDEANRCEEEGAAILHIHADRWAETITSLRESTSLVLQCGMSSLPIPERMEVFTAQGDIISIITSHHDEAFTGLDVHVLHPREELIEYAELSTTHDVKLELEIWHTGGIWNTNYLIERGLLEAPYFTSLFFGWPGGSWSPATVDEYERRRSALPEGSVATVSVMGTGHHEILSAAIQSGDHVRVGTEDFPFDRNGEPTSTHQLVAEIRDVAQRLGRELATPDEARRICGLKRRAGALRQPVVEREE
jgi:3-keto-5-aminohexanoate cleavage enzyme